MRTLRATWAEPSDACWRVPKGRNARLVSSLLRGHAFWEALLVRLVTSCFAWRAQACAPSSSPPGGIAAFKVG
jgi:hypothetical protein